MNVVHFHLKDSRFNVIFGIEKHLKYLDLEEKSPWQGLKLITNE